MPIEIIQIPVGPMANFAYLVVDADTKHAVVVDPGWESETILNVAKDAGLTIDGVWLTHTHFDHIQEVPAIMTAAGVPVWVHTLEKDLLGDVPGDVNLLNEGDLVQVGGCRAQVLHTPGHSPGGICYLIDDHLITGDSLFVGAVGRTDLPGSDPRAMGQSLKRLAQLPEHLNVYPGHDYGDSPTSTIAHEKRTNPYMRL
ncbi:MAG: hypothetical protein COV45_01835 [Deltaproteobacteria bacterium CG11_big_fil_rev_8_21_14_0_20_47_16]|nr:MAG: hypothetical protein COV45_01835 [Deltaproteobacteria bacterium CG11_big_fil_rev_8_21_14_0_20_47_16]